MKSNTSTIILCGGEIDYYHLPINTNSNNSMVPVNGKPVIGWILEDLFEKGIFEPVIVCLKKEVRFKQFVNRVYGEKLKVQFVEMDTSISIVDTLRQGLESISDAQEVRVLLGDTLIRDSFENTADKIYIQEVSDSRRWCLVSTDDKGKVSGYYEKEKDVPRPYLAVTGYYHFSDCPFLLTKAQDAVENGETQMSQLLGSYQGKHAINAVLANVWHDFGNIDNLNKAKQQLLQSRYFNSLIVDPVLNTITKISEFDEKLRDELSWYEKLPDHLKVLTPRIVSKKEVDDKLNLVSEYYGYPNLAELYLFGNLPLDSWRRVVARLFEIHGELEKYTVPAYEGALRQVYFDKTTNRIKDLKEVSDYWKRIFELDRVVLNEKELLGFEALWERLKGRVEQLCDLDEFTIIHGDYCFSNILFDINSQIARLIDPRGSFGKKGIYGDPRYDIAKLRHSIVGCYDFIVSDMFNVSIEGNRICLDLHMPEGREGVKKMFDDTCVANGYDPLEIKLIEGLLFISMIPLHLDKPERQKVMFAVGLERLNELV